MKKMAEAMSQLPGVISVALVTGRFDLVLTVILSPEFELIDFFNIMLERRTAMQRRHALRDDQWERIKDALPGKVEDPGRTSANNRLFIEAVMWIAKTGAPWRDLPSEYGRSRGGFGTKIHALADALGNPMKFILTGGEKSDYHQALPLLSGEVAGAVLADKGYDADYIIEEVIAMEAEPVIPPRSTRKNPRAYDEFFI
ncbi:hypothetical protein AAG570_014160 [Ranatra chinensis]|uniref:Insertion element IS402-like domain-containing protein n=1 Tax=Ranatra chinensis TaxID=642074 RepID=A0ABD0Y7L8_9HEMI